MIIAFFGPSQTGKTTIAKHLAAALGLPLRSCGEVVKRRSIELGLSIDDLPNGEHHAIDEETRIWVTSHRPCLVEGRFLDHVLSPLAPEVVFISLEATTDDRQLRQGGGSLAEFAQAEADDLALRRRLYTMTERVRPSVAINTSQFSVEACVACVRALVGNVRNGRA